MEKCDHSRVHLESWNGSVYKICWDCDIEFEPTPEEIESMNIEIMAVD